MRQNFAPDLSLARAQGEEDAAHCQYFTAWRASCRSAPLTILLSLGPFFFSSLSFFLTYEILKSVGQPGSVKHVTSHKIKTCQTLFPLFGLCCLKNNSRGTRTLCVCAINPPWVPWTLFSNPHLLKRGLFACPSRIEMTPRCLTSSNPHIRTMSGHVFALPAWKIACQEFNITTTGPTPRVAPAGRSSSSREACQVAKLPSLPGNQKPSRKKSRRCGRQK